MICVHVYAIFDVEWTLFYHKIINKSKDKAVIMSYSKNITCNSVIDAAIDLPFQIMASDCLMITVNNSYYQRCLLSLIRLFYELKVDLKTKLPFYGALNMLCIYSNKYHYYFFYREKWTQPQPRCSSLWAWPTQEIRNSTTVW